MAAGSWCLCWGRAVWALQEVLRRVPVRSGSAAPSQSASVEGQNLWSEWGWERRQTWAGMLWSKIVFIAFSDSDFNYSPLMTPPPVCVCLVLGYLCNTSRDVAPPRPHLGFVPSWVQCNTLKRGSTFVCWQDFQHEQHSLEFLIPWRCGWENKPRDRGWARLGVPSCPEHPCSAPFYLHRVLRGRGRSCWCSREGTGSGEPFCATGSWRGSSGWARHPWALAALIVIKQPCPGAVHGAALVTLYLTHTENHSWDSGNIKGKRSRKRPQRD